MTEATPVGHCRQDSTDVYIGRGRGGRDMTETQIGTRGWLGNPYTLEEYDREASINTFANHFRQRILNDPEFAEAVADLHGETLGCWCQRLDDDSPACHGEVIATWADILAQWDDE